MELWDARDGGGKLLGFDLVRGEDIPEGVFHAVADVFVMHEDGTVLLMQRALEKQGLSGRFEAGASGSVLKGERPCTAAIRELREETGLVYGELTPLFVYCDEDLRAIWHGYLFVTDCEKDSIRLQPGETMAYQWMAPANFLDFTQSKRFAPKQLKVWLPYYRKWLNGGRLEPGKRFL